MIAGKGVRLRRIEREDLPRFTEWMNDPELRAHLAQVYPLSRDHELQWFEATLRLEPALQPFAIEADLAGRAPRGRSARTTGRTREEGRGLTLVGTIGLHNLDWRHRTAELGLFIGPRELWGKGYGTDALRLFAGFAFGELNLHRLWLRLYDDNARARRSYEKVGFRLEGRLRQDHFKSGRYHDTLVMGLLRSEWKN